MDSSIAPKDEMWFLRVCHHVSNDSLRWLQAIPASGLEGSAKWWGQPRTSPFHSHLTRDMFLWPQYG